jgi:hypothetical protein
VTAGVHHDDAVAGSEKEFGLADYADAVVGDAMEEQDPIAVGMIGANNPASQETAVACLDVEIFSMPAGMRERGVSFADEVLGKLPTNGVKESWRDEPARNASQEGGQEENYA